MDQLTTLCQVDRIDNGPLVVTLHPDVKGGHAIGAIIAAIVEQAQARGVYELPDAS